MLNARSESKAHRRLVTISKDGATNWSTPKFDDALLEPICMASMVRYSTVNDGGKNRILFATPTTSPAPMARKSRANIAIAKMSR